jgi:mRNA interferase MazF
VGHEQEGYRPAIVVGIPKKLGRPRFDMVLLVPLTTDRNQSWVMASPKLYPRLGEGAGGLPRASVVLLEQARTLDTSRMARYVGKLSGEEYAPIKLGIAQMCELEKGKG